MADAPGHYRDELGAAHARIAELERELADARGERGPGAVPDALATMIGQRRAFARSLEPRQMNLFSLLMGVVPFVVFGVIGLALRDPIPIAMGAGFGVLMAGLMRIVLPPTNRRALAALDEKIAEARRIRALEIAMAEMHAAGSPGVPLTTVRVVTEEPAAHAADAPSAAVRRA